MTLEAEKMEAWGADESALFDAARGDGPSAESSAGLYAALGLAPPLPGGGGEGQSSPYGAPIPVFEPVVQSGIFARPIARLAAGAGALAIAIPAFLWMQGGDTESSSNESVAQVEAKPVDERQPAAQEVVVADDSAAAESAQPESEAVAIDSLPTVTDSHVKVPSASAKASDATQRPTLKEELAHLQRARAALNSGNISLCEALLQEHRNRFVPPRLASEARVLRVEAYVAQGRMAEAKATAAPLLKSDSPYRARMETLLSK